MSIPLNPASLEKELNKIQRELAPAEARSSLFNLVIFSPYQELNYIQNTLNGLLGKRPARIIYVLLDYLEKTHTQITARCMEDYQNKGVCFQEVLIFCGPDGSGEDPGTWNPLLIRDIPTYIWWNTPLFPVSHLFTRVEDQGDKILIDSEKHHTPTQFYKELWKKHSENTLWISDYTWQRLMPLVKLTARLFNPEEDRDALFNINKVELHLPSNQQYWLYLSWLSSRLDWKLEKWSAAEACLIQGNRKIQLSFINTQDPEEIRLIFGISTREIYSIDIKGTEMVNLHRGGKEAYSVSYNSLDEGTILLKEVDRPFTDRLYFDAIGWMNNNL